MKYNVSALNPQYDFDVTEPSYVGNPKDGTVMFITDRVSKLVENLKGHNRCLVFITKGINVSKELQRTNLFIECDDAQREYANFISVFALDKEKRDRARRYHLSTQGYYIGDNVMIGKDAYIEPGVIIGHDVCIGDHAHIMANSVIKNAVIGDNVQINECAVIGASGFTMAEDESGDKFRLPTLGKVIIGNNVEIGTHDNISCGSGGDTIIEDNAKLDTMVHIGHDAYIGKNAELTAGVIVGGFTHIGEHGYMGINSAIRNRRELGRNSIAGMGAVVLKSVEDNTVIVGNPGRFLKTRGGGDA